METLYEALIKYAESDYVPMHMPGHKRQRMNFADPYSFDITEIDGFDNLHHAEGILKEAQEYAAAVCSADETHFLVGGSSSGILSAVYSVTNQGGVLLMARNCHKSVYHAAELRQLKTCYIYPESLQGGIAGEITAESVKEALEAHPEANALILTSPTYDGVVSDICEIVRIAHSSGIPVIVDEAHGAHFLKGSGFPKSAVRCGADVVIQSTHKTLPALTQTALIHIRRDYPYKEKLRKYLSVFQTSSPSYVLMASIDACMHWYAEKGQEVYQNYLKRLKNLRGKLKSSLKYLHLLTPEKCFDYDISKIIIDTGSTNFSGEDLHQMLLKKYRIQVEMVSAKAVLCMTSAADREEFYERLLEALVEIDGLAEQNQLSDKKSFPVPEAKAVFTIGEAAEKKKKKVMLMESIGKICASYIYIYPPGIPILTPGEKISKECVSHILFNLESGLTVHGLTENKEIEILWEEYST